MSDLPVFREQMPSGSALFTLVQGQPRNGHRRPRRMPCASSDRSSTGLPNTSPNGNRDINEPGWIIGEDTAVVNVASVPKLSPFRYPGGKTWLVPTVLKWVRSFSRRPKIFVEPFAGGGIVGLSVAFQDLADEVVLIELDEHVAAVWETILGDDSAWLIDRIVSFKMTRDRVIRELESHPASTRDVAFQTILRNRVQRGGILAPGASLVKNGENGKGVASRWYPETLARRILEISQRRDRITFIRGDAFSQIPRYLRSSRNTFFVDPPYTAGGKSAGSRLYTHSRISHERLFSVAARASGPVMMTYDDCGEVARLAETYGFACARIPMKNTHHSVMHELLITNNASLLEQQQRRALAKALSSASGYSCLL